MTQTWALLVDAYRELNAKKLFWITLALSGLVVAATACIGINERGIELLVWTLDAPVNTTLPGMTEERFYKELFINFGLGIWLTWIATVLGLVSTAAIFPDFVSGGSIEMSLSKPISRTRLFLTKYALGLLFMTLQVTVFTVASFLVLGLRGGVWEFGVFLAIPLVVLFFSYLFSVCALLGLLTRSTIASLLLTILFWFLLFILNAADAGLMQPVLQYEQEIENRRAAMANAEARIERLEAAQVELRERAESADARPSDRQALADNERSLDGTSKFVERAESGIERAEESKATWEPWHEAVVAIKTPLPKTGETIALLERWLIDAASLREMRGDWDESMEEFVTEDGEPVNRSFDPDQRDQQRAIEEEYRSRSVWWVLGTSVAFEVVVLLVATVVFVRRDF